MALGDFLGDPLVRFPHPGFERLARTPSESLLDEMVVRGSPANAGGSRDMHELQPLAGDPANHRGELVDRDHLRGADVHRAAEIRLDQAPHAFETLVELEK